jgi:hypothetical protein
MLDGGIAPPFLTSAETEVSGQLHVPAALPPEEVASRYPLNRRVSSPRAGQDAMENIKIFTLSGTKPRPSNP